LRATLNRVSAKLKFRFLIFLSALFGAHARADEGEWRVFLEPKFLRAAVTSPIPSAKKTDLTAGRFTDGELQVFSKDDFTALGVEWDKFAERARQNAASDLASLKPRFERNSRKTIVYGALESEKPVVASAVLAPGFLDLWKDTLGEKVLVVVPNRHTAFVFPHIASDYQSYYPMVFRAYHDSAHPISVEVFEVSKTGWRCVGVYQEP
jgi:hypothetical protein